MSLYVIEQKYVVKKKKKVIVFSKQEFNKFHPKKNVTSFNDTKIGEIRLHVTNFHIQIPWQNKDYAKLRFAQ